MIRVLITFSVIQTMKLRQKFMIICKSIFIVSLLLPVCVCGGGHAHVCSNYQQHKKNLCVLKL